LKPSGEAKAKQNIPGTNLKRVIMRAAPIRPLLPCVTLFLLAGCATPPPPGEAEVLPARVFRLKGMARWRADVDQPWQEVKAGTRLPQGAVIQTAVESRVDICLGRSPKRVRTVVVEHPSGRTVGHTTMYDNMIRLWENSLVRFDGPTQERSVAGTRPAENVRLDLSAGHMFGRVPKLAEGSRYEISFPGGAARVTGAVYDISVEGYIKVVDGSVSVAFRGSPKPQIIMSNQQLDLRTGVLSPIPNPDRW
jgi:hypothetical protein